MTWWDNNYKRADFRSWISGDKSLSRIIVTDMAEKYKNVLDCACGTCLDYFKYQGDGSKIKYKGIDSCKGLVEEARTYGIDCDHGSIEKLPYKDKQFEVVTARHILEHLPYFEKALREMCRVARYEVIIVFFMPPGEERLGKDANLNNEVYLNTYSREKVEEVAREYGDIEWSTASSEAILRITKTIRKRKRKLKNKKKVGIACTIYIDNDKTYEQAIHTLDSIQSEHNIKLYARVTKLNKKYRDILKRFDSVKRNPKNILAKSWNNGIRYALRDGCDYVIVPNLDIELMPDTIDELVKFANKSNADIWSAWSTGYIGRNMDKNFVVSSYTVYDNFACFMVNDRLFKKVKGFDENYIPCYGEDVDLQYRLELVKGKHICVASAKFIHFGQTTQRNSPDFKKIQMDKPAHKYFVKKWGGFPRQHKFKTPFNK